MGCQVLPYLMPSCSGPGPARWTWTSGRLGCPEERSQGHSRSVLSAGGRGRAARHSGGAGQRAGRCVLLGGGCLVSIAAGPGLALPLLRAALTWRVGVRTEPL